MLRSIAVIVALIFGFGASILSPLAALLSYIWFALFRPQEWVWFDLSALRISLFLGIILLVRCFVSGVFPRLWNRLALGCIVFLLTGIVAQATAVRPEIGWEWLDYFARLILVALLIPSLCTDRKRFTWTIAVVAGSLGFHTAKAGVAVVISGGHVRFSDGLAGAFVDNNGYALAAVMILPFLIATSQNIAGFVPFGKWVSRGFMIAVPLTCLTVVGTFSRAGFLAMSASIIVFLLLQKKKLRSVIVLGVVIAVAIPFVSLPKGYVDRLDTIRTYDEIGEDSALGRLHFWRVSLDMAKDNPLGVGLRSFAYAYDAYDFLKGRFGRARSVHSTHLQILAENGWLGFATWIFLLVFGFQAAFRIRRRSRNHDLREDERRFLFTMSNAIITSMAGFIVGGSFISLSLNDLTWLTFGLLIALETISHAKSADLSPADSCLKQDPAVEPEKQLQWQET